MRLEMERGFDSVEDGRAAKVENCRTQLPCPGVQARQGLQVRNGPSVDSLARIFRVPKK